MNTMTPEHVDWKKFCDALASPEFCNFTEDGRWLCAGGTDKTFAVKLLERDYPDVDIEETLSYFENHGGFCDCEILFNVDPDS